MKRVFVSLCVALLFLATSAQAQEQLITIQAPTGTSIINGTTLRNTIRLPTGVTQVDLLINVTTTGTATGTVQWFIEDSADGGTTWDDLIASNTFAFGAAAVNQRYFISGNLIPSTITTATSVNTTQGSVTAIETAGAGSARQGPFSNLWRLREKITAIGGSPVGPSFTITAIVK